MVSKELKNQAIKWFKQKYPNANNIDKFQFGYNLDDVEKLKCINVYYNITPNCKDGVLITDKGFILFKHKTNCQ